MEEPPTTEKHELATSSPRSALMHDLILFAIEYRQLFTEWAQVHVDPAAEIDGVCVKLGELHGTFDATIKQGVESSRGLTMVPVVIGPYDDNDDQEPANGPYL